MYNTIVYPVTQGMHAFCCFHFRGEMTLYTDKLNRYYSLALAFLSVKCVGG